MPAPKQHHYIPETYLQNFCGSDDRLWIYDKWKGTSFKSRPSSVLKEKFYYAQPDHQKKTWNHDIEKLFSEEVESLWPDTVRIIQRGPEHISELKNLYMWLYSLRVRVPNCRKAVEYSLQEQVKLVGRNIKDEKFAQQEKETIAHINQLLGKKYTCMDELYDDGVIQIAIDPHKSIEAMADLAQGFSRLVAKLQMHFITNKTKISFLSSDNPVVYFPAEQSIDNCTPYQFSPETPFEFIFPITKNICLYHNSLYPIRAEQIVKTETNDINFVETINAFVGAFADRHVVSPTELTEDHKPILNRCPRPISYSVSNATGKGLFLRYEMGEPLRLPKWKQDFESQ